MSWFRKYRPRQVKDLHLASVRETLLALMAEGKIPQAILFAGPKGTGKTSASRIIAAILNDERNSEAVDQIYLQMGADKKASKKKIALVEPDPDSALTQRICAGQSFAVQEIDAASHGLVDDVRQLKEKASLLPQEGKMAVYILDEAHMMSSAAFNAFLKLLEEPPAHAVFILATTELHKIPATIASRCLLVRFQKASDEEISTTLSNILAKEGVSFKPAQLTPIITAADGSFRDAVKLLELSVADGKLNSELITQVAGDSLDDQLTELIEAVLAKNEVIVTQLIAGLRSVQADVMRVHKTLFTLLHTDLVAGLTGQNSQRKAAINQFLLQQLLAANLTQPTPIPLLPLEIALLDLISRAKQKAGGSSTSINSKASKLAATETRDEDEDEMVMTSAVQIMPKVVSSSIREASNAVVVAEVTLPITSAESPSISSKKKLIDPQILLSKWQDFLAAVSAKNPSLAALLRSSQPNIQDNGGMTIGVFYRFHQEQLQQPKFLSILEACCREVAGGDLPFSFALTDAQAAIPASVSAPIAAGTIEVVPTNTLTESQAVPSGLAAMASEVLL